MTIEERLKLLLGDKDFVIAALQVQLEEANNKIKELEGDRSGVTELKKRQNQ
jgi:hypothetical protein